MPPALRGELRETFIDEGVDRMNKKIWRTLLVLGIVPFLIPFFGFGYEMLNASNWTLLDYLVLYSFLYWPTYVVGLALIILSVWKLRGRKSHE